MALNDELLSLDKKIKYYTLDTFKNIPAEAGIYSWFYPLRLQKYDLESLISEINFVFNFCNESHQDKKSTADFRIGWRDYTLETKLRELKETSALIKTWKEFIQNNKNLNLLAELNQVKKTIFISSVFMPPLYIGKTKNLYNRCFQHINGGGNNNIFHNRFKKYVKNYENISCHEVEDLIFATISTKSFGLEDSNYEALFEGILMNLIKPIFSIK